MAAGGTGTGAVGGTCLAPVATVGSRVRGNGKWGQSDLAGNLSEWILDGFSSSYPMPCSDCAQLTTTSARVVRGGAFDDASGMLRASVRDNAAPGTRNYNVGARCAREP